MIRDMNEQILFPDDETAWKALLERDARYNGVVYFGVRSTGIYCRPTCPARKPRREQVVFFASWEAAEGAGFRPCRRCQPRAELEPQAAMVERARRMIDAAEETPSLEELSSALGVSPFHFQRTFKAHTGLTPRQYAAARKLEKFKNGVREGQDVTTALYEAGYGSSSRLYESANTHLGMTPGAYRRGGKGVTIHYTIVDSALGRLLVAGTDRGICAVYLDEQDATLEAALAREYPQAERMRVDPESPLGSASDPLGFASGPLSRWASAIQQYLQGANPQLDLPLDVPATPFQLRVWEALRRIPYGETRTYTQLAQSIGQPAAVRAVARACATNPAALVNPCHRIIRSDGSLGGYRWGLSRKQALLEQEKAR